MAELSYGDVQRAVQDGLRNMQGGIQHLASQVSKSSSRSQQAQLDNIQASLQQLDAHITRLEQQTRRHDPYSEQMMAQMNRDIQDLRSRFNTVEKFCTDMSRYVQMKHEEDLEKKQYRSA